MTFLFLLKKNSVGGISSIGIGVKSLMNIAFVLEFPLVNCNGVTTSMGLSISVDNCFLASLVVDFSGEDDDLSYPFFIIVSF
jgi:hypothetical protein